MVMIAIRRFSGAVRTRRAGVSCGKFRLEARFKRDLNWREKQNRECSIRCSNIRRVVAAAKCVS